MSDNNKVYISSDYAFNHPDRMKRFEDYGDEVIPVDLNWAAVPKSKNDPSNFKNAQASLRRRFSLGDE